MAVFDPLKALGQVLLPKSTSTSVVSSPVVYNSTQPSAALAALSTNNHMRDLISERQSSTDNDIIETLMVYDPDVGAATNAYLTLANQNMRYLCRDENKQIDLKAQQIIDQLVMSLGHTNDYTQGFTMNRSMNARNADLRYMLIKRGSIAGELVLDKNFGITDMQMVDTNTLTWYSPKPNKRVPSQKSGNKEIKIDIPQFFYTSLRQDPSKAYSKSFFISVINTVYSRLQMINDLYDLMKITGYPRLDIKIVEEVIVKSMPEVMRNDPNQKAAFINGVIGSMQNSMATIRPDQPIVHTDSIEVGMVNDKGGSVGINVQPIIDTLDSQNQTALRSMATILGRGTSGVNTASVESRIFSMSAAEINDPIADFWSAAFTFALRLSGSLSVVEVFFDEPEMRPPNELEPSKVIMQTRLQKDLSLGLISDEEYHLQMYNRLPPANAPKLSGTGFLDKVPTSVTESLTPPAGNTGNNSGTVNPTPATAAGGATGSRQATPLQKAATSPAAKAAKSNTIAGG